MGKSVFTLNKFRQLIFVLNAIIQTIHQWNRNFSNFVWMRKFMSILTMILVLLSSGAAQMAYHVCDEDGVHVWSGDCETGTQGKKELADNCCKSKDESKTSLNTAANCCTEAYFFSLLPLPVSLVKFKLEKTVHWNVPAWVGLNTASKRFTVDEQSVRSTRQHPPDDLPCRPHQAALCVWVI
jgi:hypothetical protein